MKQSKKGFTLLEMMLVVSIIVDLSGVTLATASDLISKSKGQTEAMEQHTMLMNEADRNILSNPRAAKLPAIDVNANHDATDHTNNGGTNNGNHNGEPTSTSNNNTDPIETTVETTVGATPENSNSSNADQSGHTVIHHSNDGGSLTITTNNNQRIESVTITIIRGNDSEFTNVN